MQLQTLAQLYQQLEATDATLEKTQILADFFQECSTDDLELLPNLAMGRPFPPWSELEIGIADQMMIEAISKATGANKQDINDRWRETGDLGNVTKYFLEHRKQATLLSQELTVHDVYSTLQKIATAEGQGSQDKKITAMSELITSTSPDAAVYLVRLALETLRIGVGEGIVRDSLAKAFDIEKDVLERAFYMLNDYGQVARIAKEAGEDGLKKVKMRLFYPVKVMLAQKAETIDDAFSQVGDADGTCAVEFKLDGMRGQIHKQQEKVKIFTRRLEDITPQFPDIVQAVRNCVMAEEVILDVEITAHEPESYAKVPFQELSQRIKRKYNIEQMVQQIPVIVNAFDILFHNGENTIGYSLHDRWERLESVVQPHAQAFTLVKHVETNNTEEAQALYSEAMQANHEGLMLKNIQSAYTPGSRVGHVVKLKPTMEHLDLVIVGGEWGEGKRSHWLSSYRLACRDAETGELQTIGKMATGLTEEEFADMTDRLSQRIMTQDGRHVSVQPEVVVEVGYAEIQQSPTYSAGYALRFPRLIRVREDLSVHDIDTTEKIHRLYSRK